MKNYINIADFEDGITRKENKMTDFTAFGNSSLINALVKISNKNTLRVYLFLHMELSSFQKNRTKIYEVNVANISKVLGIDHHRIPNHIDELIELGFIKIIEEADNNRHLAFIANPFSEEEAAEVKKENVQKAHLGNHVDGKNKAKDSTEEQKSGEEILEEMKSELVETTVEPEIYVNVRLTDDAEKALKCFEKDEQYYKNIISFVFDDNKKPELPLPEEDDFDYAEIFLSDSEVTAEEVMMREEERYNAEDREKALVFEEAKTKEKEVEAPAKKDYFDCLTEQKDKEFAKEETQIQPDEIYFLFVRDNHILDDFTDKEVTDIISNGKRFGMINRDYVVNMYNN